ncbi:hypothetical protein DFJ66_8015 [Saccharothrix variisporea]|uniref:Uncharacterized protein n=1 Tax=Saccharothrix variisporea TaxID=543527 RepID=A0A495XSK2_9PSEU|nr:hypothetical protein DFJ66_8015 [Saccharothrix variisporea]
MNPHNTCRGSVPCSASSTSASRSPRAKARRGWFRGAPSVSPYSQTWSAWALGWAWIQAQKLFARLAVTRVAQLPVTPW